MTRLRARLWREYIRQVRASAAAARWSDRKTAMQNHRKTPMQISALRSAAGIKGNYARWQKPRLAAAAARDRLIVEHMQWARTVARKVFATLTKAGQDGYHSHIEIEDVVGWAHVGLIQAADRYSASQGSFQGFAYRRVRGAIIDAFRRKQYTELTHESVEGFTERLGFMPARYSTDRAPLPDEIAIARQEQARLERAIAELPDDEREVLREAQTGARVSSIASARGRSANWGRAKLDAAKGKVKERLLCPPIRSSSSSAIASDSEDLAA